MCSTCSPCLHAYNYYMYIKHFKYPFYFCLFMHKLIISKVYINKLKFEVREHSHALNLTPETKLQWSCYSFLSLFVLNLFLAHNWNYKRNGRLFESAPEMWIFTNLELRLCAWVRSREQSFMPESGGSHVSLDKIKVTNMPRLSIA